MINQFLATLDNNPVSPANFIWPTFTVRALTNAEASIRGAVIGVGLSREQNFFRCLQLVNLVQESPLVGYVTAADSRVTFSKQSIRDRFALSGVIVQDTSDTPSDSTLTMVVRSTTPDIISWTLAMTDATTCVVTDDTGNSVARTVTFGSGVSDLIDVPGEVASFRFTVAAPADGDSWSVSYQRAGSSWVQSALTRLAGAEPTTILTGDLLQWYTNAPTQIDKLAAVVVALGTAE